MSREAFDKWCDETWGSSSWKHKSNTCGEWDAWNAALEHAAKICEDIQEVHDYSANKCAEAIRKELEP